MRKKPKEYVLKVLVEIKEDEYGNESDVYGSETIEQIEQAMMNDMEDQPEPEKQQVAPALQLQPVSVKVNVGAPLPPPPIVKIAVDPDDELNQCNRLSDQCKPSKPPSIIVKMESTSNCELDDLMNEMDDALEDSSSHIDESQQQFERNLMEANTGGWNGLMENNMQVCPIREQSTINMNRRSSVMHSHQ